jgi:CDP-diacylglycerol--serine O-phosphatidyltransferase
VLFRHPTIGLLCAFLFVGCAAVRLARFNVLSGSVGTGPVKPGKYIIGLPTPPASGILISLMLANHAVGGALGGEEYTAAIFVTTAVLSLLMVSNVRFRSFKDLRLNSSTIALVLFTILSSAFVWRSFKPQFVLIWLLSVYILIGLVETLRVLASRLRNQSRDSVPPAIDHG